MLAVGSARAHGSNDGYDDEPSKRYHWNSSVPNHAQPADGDVIAIWNKVELVGVSVIEAITATDDVDFDHNACPNCGRSSIKRRKVKKPGWLCFDCHHQFDNPRVDTRKVRDYHTAHGVAWVDLLGVLDAAALRKVCLEPRSQLSIRELNWDGFRRSIAGERQLGSLGVVEQGRKQVAGGFKSAVVRARIGQAGFRASLIAKFGNCCAISGPQPRSALDAAHLYSYAKHGSHDEHGGLLLRKDIHRLFDLGLLCIRPESLIVDVHPDLQPFPAYAAHHNRVVPLKLPRPTRDWLRMHWTMHRE